MAGGVLVRRSGVENQDVLRSGPFQELAHLHRLCIGPLGEMLSDQPFEVGEATFGNRADGGAEREDRGIGKPIGDIQPFLAALNQGGLPERPKVLRSVRQRLSHLGREGIDGAFSLGEELQYLEPVRTGQGFADSGQLPVECVFEVAVGAGRHSQVINIVLDYYQSSGYTSVDRLIRHVRVSPARVSRRAPHAMSVYAERILPYIVHMSMGQSTFTAYRRRLVPAAEGRVLEIGIGSGLNLPFYGKGATHVIGLDPSSKMLSMARESTRGTSQSLELLEASAEAIPLDDQSVDTVVSTWTLCTIPDVMCALGEMRRVLKPGGRLLFVEHGRSTDASVRRWQDRLTPLWKRIGGGCHLNRAIAQLVAESGFRIERMETGYMKGPKAMTFMYEGGARPS
jgi:ubiquinone/menaquinone biosynthesis C-methylase UbiE